MAKQVWDKVSTVHILPGELTAKVYWHTIPYNPPIPCWTYVTQGLSAHQQKELVITVKRSGTADDEAPGFVSELLMYIFALAKQGRTVDAGAYTSLTLTDKEKKVGLPFNLLYLNPISPLPNHS